jgi:hypothetical protein
LNKVQTLVICKKQFETQEEFKQRLVDAITVLLDSEYILKVKADESNIIVIEYEHDDQSFGTPYPYWLTPEQVESIPIGGEEE